MAQDYLPQNERSEVTAKIAGVIRRRGLMGRRDIQQFLKGRMDSKAIMGILDQLVEAGEIEWTGQAYRSCTSAAAG